MQVLLSTGDRGVGNRIAISLPNGETEDLAVSEMSDNIDVSDDTVQLQASWGGGDLEVQEGQWR